MIESVDGKERFVTAVPARYDKDMAAEAEHLLGPLIDDSVDLVVCDRACAGMLTYVENTHPR